MTDPRWDAGSELKSAAGRPFTKAGEAHLSLDEIAAYHAGSLPADEEARLQDHLVACPECAGLLLERDEFAQLLRGAVPVPEEQQPAASVLPFARPVRQTAPARGWQAALAASLLAVVGLAFATASLRRTVDELSQPQVNASIQDLAPTPLRGEGEAREVALAPETRFFTLVLNPAGGERFADCEVEIAREDGEVVWRGRGLHANEYGSFPLTLARRLMSDGAYRIRLRGIGSAGVGTPLGEYRLRIATRR